MRLRTLVVFSAFALATAAFAQDENILSNPSLGLDIFQVRYASNLNKGDSVINITNSGSDGEGGGVAGNICANVYTFDASEEMVSCCSCVVTPNALVSLSVQGDLISNTLSPSTPTSVVIKLVATDFSDQGGICDPSLLGALGTGMRAWGTTLHALPDGTYGTVETSFQAGGVFPDNIISRAERTHLSTFCSFIQTNGSGFGICKSCRAGGLGGAKQ